MNKLLFLLGFMIIFYQSSAQSGLWSEFKDAGQQRLNYDIQTTASKKYTLQIDELSEQLNSLSRKNISIPLPDGTFEEFVVRPVEVLSSELSAKFPSIKTYIATGANGSTARIDITPKGFHAMIFTRNGTAFIDPINKLSKSTYLSYYKKDYITKSVALQANDIVKTEGSKVDLNDTKPNFSARTSGTELRTYRLAVTATGEYTQFHGGTVTDGLAAIVTTMNRVNGIYEREVGIRMVLVGNNDLIIYTDPATDPYDGNEDPSTYINEVQSNIDAIIGTANYDIGHGFSTGAGGLAGIGPCTSTKATGVTGISSPIGDPFDVDFVAHEIGHQFSANHTFNGNSGSCVGGNRNSSTAYEPGSGTTILAYAGICTSQNIQNNSDPYFHTVSYDEILTYSVDGSGNSCASVTSTGNNPPTVNAGAGGFVIPISTPFELIGSGSDDDGDELTFSWEQFDLGPTGEPNSPEDNAPIFRSLPPKDEPIRTFPDISDIINNTQTLGELLPTYSRDLTFRLTARDNKNGGGGVNYDQIAFEVSDQAGPFLITSFNTSTSLVANTNIQLTWDVANTNVAPVNATNVEILFSEDGGLSFPYTLSASTANDGSESVVLPDVNTTQARIKVKALNNVFFDINNVDITVTIPTEPDFNLSLSANELEICAPADGQIEVNVGSILSFSNPVTLEVIGLADNLTATFSSNPVTPGNSTTLTISNTEQGANGDYNLTINATESGNTKSQNLLLTVYDDQPESLTIISPMDLATDISIFPEVAWTAITGTATYEVDIATDSNFSNIILSESNIENTSLMVNDLDANTTYFLRVRGINSCKTTEYDIISFTTGNIQCIATASSDTPINISPSGTPVITSEINISASGIISDVNIINLQGEHTYVSDLTFILESPSGTEVTLVGGICGDLNDFDFSFDDSAASSNIPCPPTTGETFQPSGLLADFNGEDMNGIWILSIQDAFNLDGGQLSNWTLEICGILADTPAAPLNLTGFSNENENIELSWDDIADNETGYVIERSEIDNANYSSIGSTDANITFFEDSTMTVRSTFFYRISAVNDAGSSAFSNEISITQRPDNPINLSAQAITKDQINLTWEDLAANETEYIIERSRGNNSNFNAVGTVSANETSFEDTSLPFPDTYFYRVAASNASGESGYSNESEASTLVLSASQVYNNDILVFPNPTTRKVVVKFDQVISDAQFELIDFSGKSYKLHHIPSGEEYLLDLKDFSAGMYMLQIKGDAKKMLIRLIVNK